MNPVLTSFEIPAGLASRRGPTRSAQVSTPGYVPFEPAPITIEQVRDRRIVSLCPHAGTYGMGGPGFFAIEFEEDPEPEWLVVSLWSATNWLLFDGRLVGDSFFAEHARPEPWMRDEADELTPRIVGSRVREIAVEKHSLRISLDSGGVFEIDETPARRPIWEGSGEPRQFSGEHDLRQAVFLSPTLELLI